MLPVSSLMRCDLLQLKWTGLGIASLFSREGNLESKELTDVSIVVINKRRERHVLRAHRLVLAACSDYLSHMLMDVVTAASAVVMVTDVDVDVVRMLLKFLYTGKTWVPEERIDAFFTLTKTLKIKGMEGLDERGPESTKQSRRRSMRLHKRPACFSPTDSNVDLNLSSKRRRLDESPKVSHSVVLLDEKDIRAALRSKPIASIDLALDEESLRLALQSHRTEIKCSNRKEEKSKLEDREKSDDNKRDVDDVNLLSDEKNVESDSNDEEHYDDEEDDYDQDEEDIPKRRRRANTQIACHTFSQLPLSRRTRLSLNDRSDPLTELSDSAFIRRYRFDKRSFLKLVDILHKHLGAHDQRGLPLSPIQQVAVTLAHLGAAAYQKDLAADIGVVQTAICRKVGAVLNVIEEKSDEFIHMPSQSELKSSAQKFDKLLGTNGGKVALATQSFLVKLSKKPSDKTLPKEFFPEEFLIRDDLKLNKQTYAQKVLLVIDGHHFIRYANCSIPGLRRDSEAWLRSDAKHWLDQSSHTSLGTRSFPLSSSLIVPFKSTATSLGEEKAIFNGCIEAALNATSRKVIRMLRRRFPALKRPARQFYENNTLTFKAACVLHNFAMKESKCDLSFFDEEEENEDDLVVEVDDEYYEFDEDNCQDEELRKQIEEGRKKRNEMLESMQITHISDGVAKE